MSKRIFITALAALQLWLLAYRCGHPQRQDPATALFSEYLAARFRMSIPDTPHCYLLVPASGCRGGMIHTLSRIDQQRYPDGITVLTTDPQMAHTYLHQPWPVLTDSSGELDLLNLPVVNITLVVTKDRRVRKIRTTRECAEEPSEIMALLQQNR